MEYEVIIGLEVHAQLQTETKLFCPCKVEFGETPNTNICPVCMGHPGTLPKLNKKAVEYALRAALALNCQINLRSVFARKNYFYPDLPKGYQITQYEYPLAENGYIEFIVDGEKRRVNIIRLHLEEDAGKSIHTSSHYSLVDFNRCGIPLIEIVSAPEIHTPQEAVEYLKSLRQILRYIEVCDGNMEEGSLRCDANLSLREKGSKEFGTKIELKNMNSFKHIQMALHYEIERQKEILQKGGKLKQQTRMWIESEKRTEVMREKEEAEDYRYFPEPDLPELILDPNYIEEIKKRLPMLPLERKIYLQERYGLPEYDATVLTSEKEIADYFEKVNSIVNVPKMVSNFIMTEVLREIQIERLKVIFPVSAEDLAKLLQLVLEGKISGKIAKEVFEKMVTTKEKPQKIIERERLFVETDQESIKAICEKVLSENPNEVKRYKEGKKNLLGFFVGQVMKETKGKADPKLVNKILQDLLGE